MDMSTCTKKGILINMNCYLITFHTHYGATKFHKFCKKEKITAKVMPTPRELSSSCGVCVLMEDNQAPDLSQHEDMDICYQKKGELLWEICKNLPLPAVELQNCLR